MAAERFAAEKELFLQLDVQQIEALAADSEALIAKAREMAQRQGVPSAAATPPGTPTDNRETIAGEATKNTGYDA